MHEWRTEPLERIAEIRSSNVDKKTNPGEEPVRLCNYMDVYSREYITEDIEFMEATATPAEIQRFGIERGDVMITKDSETPDDIGIPTVVVDDIPKLVCGYHVALIKPNRAEVDPLYLAKQLGLADTGRYYGRLANGSTRYGLSYQSIARTPILLAPLPQQQRIAEILSTVDEAIEQTEVLIAKIKQIKAGLMHDLFTRGVTSDGQLRPPREEAPQLYKESPLGWIPKEWDLKACSEICLSVIDCKNRTPPVTEVGHPVIRTPNVRDGEFVWRDLAYTDAVSYVEWTARGRPVPGDVVITREAPVGEVCMIPDDLEASCLGQRMMLYRPDPNQVLGSYLVQVLQCTRVQKYLDIISGGSTVGHVRVGDIRSLRVPWAPMPEQEVIAPRLEAVRSQLRTLRAEALKLQQTKAGLRHDLLTGRVPVTIEGAPETKEVAASV